MTYAAPNITQVTDIFIYADTVSNGVYGAGILMALFIVVFSWTLRAGSTKNAFVAASTITVITSILFRYLSIINGMTLTIFLVIAFVSYIWLWTTEKE